MTATTRSVWLRRHNITHPLAHAPGKWWSFELTAIGAAAARETLVIATSHMAAMWTDLFESILSPSSELRWLGDGPGIGRDARVAYSGLLGRDMARAYLTECEGVCVLVPMDVARRQLERTPYVIEKDPPGRVFEADWIGLDSQGLVIVEAKGTHYGRPAEWHGPRNYPKKLLDSAINQARKTAVFERRTRRKLPAKRWAIASRWATEDNGQEPSLLAWAQDDTTLPDDDYRELSRILHRADTTRILMGLGHGQVSDIFNALALPSAIPGELLFVAK